MTTQRQRGNEYWAIEYQAHWIQAFSINYLRREAIGELVGQMKRRTQGYDTDKRDWIYEYEGCSDKEIWRDCRKKGYRAIKVRVCEIDDWCGETVG